MSDLPFPSTVLNEIPLPTAAWGVDGCKGGWFYFRLSGWPDAWSVSYGVASDGDNPPGMEKIIQRATGNDLVLVDIPIGLPNGSVPKRACDREARKLLGRKRGSSVFPAPVREVLAGDLPQTSDAMRFRSCKATEGKMCLSEQTFGILPKIDEVDRLLRRSQKAHRIVRETHPEVCFASLAGNPMKEPKKTKEGFEERLSVITRFLPDAGEAISEALRSFPRRQVAKDDIVDAMVCAITATAGLSQLQRFPQDPPEWDTNSEGLNLPMQIMYASRDAVRTAPLGATVSRAP